MATKKRAKAKAIPKPGLSVKQRAFLKAYSQSGIIAPAARLAKIHRSDHYDWMKDPGYAAAFALAHEEACEWHEAEVVRRAVVGYEEPVVYQGQLTWLPKFKDGKVVIDRHTKKPVLSNVPLTIRKFSDNLLMFRTKALMPDRYRDNVNLSGQVSVDIGTDCDPHIHRRPGGAGHHRLAHLTHAGRAARAEAEHGGGDRADLCA